MLCENCGKAPAKIHMTEIVNENEKRERHLCEACAEKEGLAVKQNFSITELLAGLAASHLAGKSSEVPDLNCPSCELTFAEFQAEGRFGCAEDYEAFGELIQPRIKKFHDATQHVGKRPRAWDKVHASASQSRSLRSELRRAVAEEAYERAAELRDEIRKLEESLNRDAEANDDA